VRLAIRKATGHKFLHRFPKIRERQQTGTYFTVMTQEHRIAPRHRTLKSGRISFADGNRAVECQIRNLSATGAQLVVPMTIILPRNFILVDMHGDTRRAAEYVWRRGDRMGVRFTDAPAEPPPSSLPRARPGLKLRHARHGSTPKAA